MTTSFKGWLKHRDRDFYESTRYDELNLNPLKLFGLLGGGETKPAAPPTRAPQAQPQPQQQKNFTDVLEPKLLAAKQANHDVANLVSKYWGHVPRIQQMADSLKQTTAPFEKWMNSIRRNTQDLVRSGGQEALQRYQQDHRLSRTLHQGMNTPLDPRLAKDKEFNAALDPRRQPGMGRIGIGNADADVRDTLQRGRQDFERMDTTGTEPLRMRRKV
jgi:hypothetical protein